MKVAVTGAAGYLGGVLLQKLAARPSVEAILALDVRPLPPALAASPKVAFAAADVRTSDLARLLGEAGPIGRVDALVHLAFIVAPIADLAAIHEVSVGGSERAFEGAAAAGVGQIVYASSIAAHGCVRGHELPIRETSPRRDQRDFYYAHTKFLVEEHLDRFEAAHPEIAVARMRPGAFVGGSPGCGMNELLSGPVLLGTTGMAAIQYTWDEDVADAFVLALEKRARGAFLVTSDDPVPFAEVAAILGKRAVILPDLLVDALARGVEAVGLARLGILHRGWLAAGRAPMHGTSAKLREVLGWTPRCQDSRAALRRLAELEKGARPNAGVWLLLSTLSLVTRLADGRLRMGDAQANLRGVETTLNLDLTGPGGSQWHVRFGDGRMRFARGLAAGAPSTARVSTAAFVRLIAGDLSFSTALFTGQVRFTGEGHAQFILGGLVTMTRRLRDAPGLAGLAPRAFHRLVLRLAGAPAASNKASAPKPAPVA